MMKVTFSLLTGLILGIILTVAVATYMPLGIGDNGVLIWCLAVGGR